MFKRIFFEEHEIRTLHSLAKEYITNMKNCDFSAFDIKPSFPKTFLIREYGESVGFNVRHQKNKLKVVYEKRNSSSYVEPTISSMGITDEITIKVYAKD